MGVKKQTKLKAWLWTSALLAAGCSVHEPDAIEGIGELGGEEPDAGIGPEHDSDGDGEPADRRNADQDRAPLAFGVVSGDYSVVSISLLEPDGTMLAEDFVHSGSATAGLVTALSGDVVLPTRSGDRGILTLIDRFTTDVVTRIDPATGEVLGQVKTQAPNTQDDDDAYSSNPYDYVMVDADEAWVTRFSPNPAVDVDDPDRGLDLLQINPTTFERTGERIDLGFMNRKATREHPDSGETDEVDVFARPGRMVRLGDKLVVGLAHLSLTFDAVGDGMVALVDLQTRQVSPLALPGLQNCPQVVPVPDDATRVAVACVGFFRGNPRASAGIAILRLDGDALEIERVFRPADDEQAPNATYGLVALDAERVVGVQPGALAVVDDDGDEVTPETWDRAYLIDLRDGSSELLFEAEGRFVVGDGSYNPRARMLLVPDGSTDGGGRPSAGVRRFRIDDGGAPEELEPTAVDAILPVRQVMPL